MKSLLHFPLAALVLLTMVFFSSLASGASGVGAAGTAASDSVSWDIYDANGAKIGRTDAHRHEDNTWHWKAYNTDGKKTDEGTASPSGTPGKYDWKSDKTGGVGSFDTGDGRTGSWTETGGQSGTATNRH